MIVSPGAAAEPSTATLEPPALEPIPQFDLISTEGPELTQVSSEWPDTGRKSVESLNLEYTAGVQKETGPDAANESIRPEQVTRESSKLRRVLAEEPTQLDSVSGHSDRADAVSLEEPVDAEGVAAYGTETESKGVQKTQPDSSGLSDAELIAARVLSSPIIKPYTSTDRYSLSSPFLEPTLSSETTKTSTNEAAESSAPLKHKDPIEVRIAPPATTETTISGPSSGPKSPKSDSKVSSWLKSKFSRRTSKPPKPESHDPENSGKAPISSVPTPTAGASSGLNRDDSSVREVAMAGKMDDGADNWKVLDDDLYVAPGSEPVMKRQQNTSSSVSSLSDVEGTRGRSELRREMTGSSESEEFEEARDHFDSEELAPPASFNNNGRASDSPVRDSKFQEDL